MAAIDVQCTAENHSVRRTRTYALIVLLSLLAGCPPQDNQTTDQPSGMSTSNSTDTSTGATGDNFVGPPAPSDPNEPNQPAEPNQPGEPNSPNEPNNPGNTADTVILTVNVVYADTFGPVGGAQVTVRTLFPFEDLCDMTTDFSGSAVCEDVPVGSVLTITATAVGSFGESLVGQTRFTVLAGFGPERTVMVQIIR